MENVEAGVRLVATIVGAVGGYEGLRRAWSAWRRRATGQDKRDEMQAVWARVDSEARKRRIYVETLHETRLIARDHGVPMDVLPPWPKFSSDTGPTDTKEKD